MKKSGPPSRSRRTAESITSQQQLAQEDAAPVMRWQFLTRVRMFKLGHTIIYPRVVQRTLWLRQRPAFWSPSSRARVAVDMMRCGASTCGAYDPPVCHIQSPSSRASFTLPAGEPLLFQLCIRDIRAEFHFVLQCSTCSPLTTGLRSLAEIPNCTN